MGGPPSIQDELERLVAETSANLAGIHETLSASPPTRPDEELLFHRLSAAIADAPDAPEALRGMLAALATYTGWPYAEAWTLRRADGLLHRAAEHHAETPRALRYSVESEGFTFPIGEGVPGVAWERREWLFVPDVAGAPLFARGEIGATSDYVGVAAIPIVAAREPVAVLLLHFRAARLGDDERTARLAALVQRVATPLRQRLVEDELAAIEREVSRSFQASSVAGLLLTPAAGDVLDVNERFLALYGYARDEVVGANALDLGLWPRAAERASAMMGVLERGEPTELGAHVRTRAGALVQVRAVLDVTDRAGTRCVRVMMLGADAPAEPVADFRALVDALPLGVCVLRGSRCLYANAAVRDALGLDEAAIPGDALAWLAPDARDEAARSGSAPLGLGVQALVARDGAEVLARCSAGVPVVFGDAPATMHTVEVLRERLASGVGSVPGPARAEG
jgi:PAS domain S-box-containing protein